MYAIRSYYGSGSAPNSGSVFFSTSESGNGNDYNTISNNFITNAGNGRQTNAIYSFGSSGSENSNITINDNLIVNCQNAGTSSQAIFLSSNTTTCNIINNNIYEDGIIIPTSGDSYAAIRVEGNGNGFTISDNKIGGSTINCGGLAWTKTNTYDNNFKAISVNTVAGTVSNVNNNKINNFNWSNLTNSPWVGIQVAGDGDVNIVITSYSIHYTKLYDLGSFYRSWT